MLAEIARRIGASSQDEVFAVGEFGTFESPPPGAVRDGAADFEIVDDDRCDVSRIELTEQEWGVVTG